MNGLMKLVIAASGAVGGAERSLDLSAGWWWENLCSHYHVFSCGEEDREVAVRAIWGWCLKHEWGLFRSRGGP
jgi:hypothetical protein